MATDSLPGEVIARDRNDYVTSMKGAFVVKRPNDDVGTGSFVDGIIASVATRCVEQSLNARIIGRSIPLAQVSGIALDQRLAQKKLPARGGERGSSGYVKITASGGGADITAGDRLTESSTKAIFQAATTGHFVDGDVVPVSAVSTGPATNFDADTVLQWSSPSSGLGLTCTVQAPGLKGGRLGETDEQVRQRISDAEADPAASSNPALYIRLAENAWGHGVPVQKAFVYRCCCGIGSVGLAILLTPGGPGTSRIPTSAHIATVRQYVKTVPDDPTRIPAGDDILLDTTIVSQPVGVAIEVRWSRGGANWRDAAPWPPRHDAGAGAIVVSAATDATHFTLARDAGSYTGETQPAVGQTIAFYNQATGTFARKRILSFTGTGPWVIVVDTTNNSSDTSYVPTVGQRASPWSESLDDLAKPVLDYFDTLGPGEQFSGSFDPGEGLLRYPPSPEKWPNSTTSHLEAAVLSVASVGDSKVREGLGVTPTVGVPGALAYLLEVGDISVFPLT